ncbi:MAG: agmatine deiminase family protein, partial [Saprospiraceae bacterium]|nr:agmatine deiminase family protein [Saprospiraceae bacterium]
CTDSGTRTAAQNYLLAKNVDISANVEFLIVPNNSVWVRDYGPNCVYANDVDSLYLIDWRYNRTTRQQDDTLANGVSRYLNLPLYTTTLAPADLVHTGGNFMSDGLGTSFSSELILSENAAGNLYNASIKTEAQIDGIMQEYMGVDRFIKMDVLPYDGIHHIDMHMKLLDEQTLLVGKYPDGISDGPQIEANIQYVLSNFKTAFGTPYKVIRIPMPPDATGRYPSNSGEYWTYANAVFINKSVLVPLYAEQYDTTALRVWREALPGYNIVGINSRALINLSGAIHCITKEIGVDDPLLITHQALPCMDNSNELQYPVWANIQHRSGIASAKIYYTTDLAQPWQSVDLPPCQSCDTSWSHLGYLPKQAAGSTVFYFIEAAANNGKVITRPLPAPAAYWSFCVTETTSLAETPAASLQAIYPNPASAITAVPVMATAPVQANLRLFNMYGQLVQTVFEGRLPAGASTYFIDASRLTSGTYWVQLRSNGQTNVQKLIVR